MRENSIIKSKYNWDVKLPEVEISDHISADLKLTPIERLSSLQSNGCLA